MSDEKVNVKADEKSIHEFYTHSDFMDYKVMFGPLNSKTIKTLQSYPVLYYLVKYDYSEFMGYNSILEQFEHNSKIEKMSKAHWYHLNIKCNQYMEIFFNGEDTSLYEVIKEFMIDFDNLNIKPIPEITINDIKKSIVDDITDSLNFKLDHLLYLHFMSDIDLKDNKLTFTYNGENYKIDYNLIRY